jgi:hypothetical protein
MSAIVKLIFIAVIVAALLLVGPWCFIWAINTLIASAMSAAPAGAYVPQIVFGFWTWLAAAITGGFAILPTLRRS